MAKKDSAVYLRFDRELSERLDRQSERLNASKSAIMRMALVKFLEEYEKTDDGGKKR
jgi:predicted transcriptional regulator